MRRDLACLLASALAAGCGGGPAADEVVVYTSVDQVFAEPVFRACEASHGLVVRAVFDTEETKSTGVLNRLVAEAAHPRADVFWSGDPVRPFVLLARGLVAPYASPAAADVPPAFRAADGAWTGLAARARVLLVNVDRLGAEAPPTSIRDLADPRWRARTAIASPVYGTTTVHAAALFAAWGDAAAQAFFTSLRDNGVRVASSNGEVRRLVAAGEVVFGLTDSDDARHALVGGDPVSVVYPDQDGLGTLLLPTSVVSLRGPRPAAGRRLVDCLLSASSEARLVAAGDHLPLRPDLATPAGTVDLRSLRAMPVDFAAVATTLERVQPWLRSWAGL